MAIVSRPMKIVISSMPLAMNIMPSVAASTRKQYAPAGIPSTLRYGPDINSVSAAEARKMTLK